MSQGLNLTASTVLLIEADPSLRRIISLGLQHQGMHVVEATSLKTIPTADLMTLDLLIFDIDAGVKSNWSWLESVQRDNNLAALPTVVLSWEGTRTGESSEAQQTCLAKPFDARALQQTVEQLLTNRARQQAALEESAEQQLLASMPRQTTASIWPVLTAVGLLLAVIGLMLHVALTVAGLLLVLTALLLWTLGTRTETDVSETIIDRHELAVPA